MRPQAFASRPTLFSPLTAHDSPFLRRLTAHRSRITGVRFTAHRSPKSIGVYHLTASGHTTRYEFTQAIISIAKELSGIPDDWASVKPIGSDQYPLPARRPRHPVTSTDKIKLISNAEC